jgi:ABC-2 type transport system ATP-binding protein
VIEVSELTKYYGERKGVGPLSFSIETGEIVGLLGLNGAGKTTTLRMLSSDLLPTSGSILIDGIDLTELPEKVRPRIGYLPERPPVYEEMAIREYLLFAGQLRGMPKERARKRVGEVMELTQLTAEQDTRIGELSHGFRQRVGIAQAIVHEPALLLLDEPIKGLDPVQIVEMRALVRSLRGRHTIVVSSHILSEISETCDRLLVIHNGELIASGSEQELAGRVIATQDLSLTVRVPESWGKTGSADGPYERLASLVRGMTGILELSARPADEPGPRILSFEVRADRDVREDLCARLVHAGVGLLSLGIATHELEKLFLELLGKTPGQAAKPSTTAGTVAAEARA